MNNLIKSNEYLKFNSSFELLGILIAIFTLTYIYFLKEKDVEKKVGINILVKNNTIIFYFQFFDSFIRSSSGL